MDSNEIDKFPIFELKPGTKAPVYNKVSQEWKTAEIVSSRKVNGEKEYYVHYQEFNKRLDEWVPSSRIDITKLVYPVTADRKRDRDKSGHYKKICRKKKTPQKTIETPIVIPEEPEKEAVPTSGSFRSSFERAHADAITRIKNVQCIQIGEYRIIPWYFSPYPIELIGCECIYICEWCLKPFGKPSVLSRHLEKCAQMHPPGSEIYRKDNLSVFEIDGRKNKNYVQYLCLLSKLFLDHKTVFYDTTPFMFYVLTSFDVRGHHFLGYFSKEKDSSEDFNLACILTLPQYQRKGYGRVLIELSYCLSKIDNKKGHPEKPFSDLGLLSYRSYWSFAIMEVIASRYELTNDMTPYITINEICDSTSIRKEDVISTLHHLKLINYYKGSFIICISIEALNNYYNQRDKRSLRIDTKCLQYKPKDFSRM